MTGRDPYRERLRARLANDWPNQARRTGKVWRWRSNDQVPPEDVLEVARELGLVTSEEELCSTAARDREMREFLAEYRRLQPAEPSAEERAEARAEHGPGVVIENVMTGRRWMT